MKENSDELTVSDRRIGGFAYLDSYPSLALFCVLNGKYFRHAPIIKFSNKIGQGKDWLKLFL